jgi:hypothetical protein
MRTATRYPHIERDDNGKLYVAGSGHKVILLIADHVAWRMNAEQIHVQHPGLTMGAIHSVLSYFYDNEAAVRAELHERWQMADDLRRQQVPRQPTREALLARGKADATDAAAVAVP